MGYVRYDLSNKRVGMTLSLRKNQLFDLPDGRFLCHSLFNNGIDLFVVSEQKRPAGRTSFKQRFWIFDHEVELMYMGNLSLLFTAYTSARDHYTFSVEAETAGNKSFLGALKIDKSGLITFANQEIDSRRAKRLYAKVLLGVKG